MNADVEAEAVERLPQRFRDAPRAFDVWQAYAILSSFDPDRWGDGWSFGFPASFSFPGAEIEDLRLDVYGNWEGLDEDEDVDHPGDGGDLFGRFGYQLPLRGTPENNPPVATGGSEAENAKKENYAWLTLDINLPGILGPGGPMPLHFCETVIQENGEGREELREFLDLFQSRLMRLWMRDISLMCPELGPIKRQTDNLPAVCALALSGMLVGGLKNNPQTVFLPGPPWEERTQLPDDVFLDAPFLWACAPMSAAGLEMLLERCLGIKVEVEQFRGVWREVPSSCRTRLSTANSKMGSSAMLGKLLFAPNADVALYTAKPSKLS